MADNTKLAVTKLNSENYHNWKFRMKLLLTKEGVWDVINKEKPTPVTADWTTKNDTATVIVGLSVEDNQLNFIRKAENAREAWINLQNHHEKSTLSNKVQLMRQICNLKLESGSMEKHIEVMTTLCDKLEALGEQLSEKWRIAMLLSSLPRSYDTLVTALETRDEDDLTLSLVQNKVIEEYKRQEESHNLSDEMAMKASIMSPRKLKIKCYFCKKMGHIKKDCKKYKLRKLKNTTGKAATISERSKVCFGLLNPAINEWIIDSGASCHISSKAENFDLLNTKSRSRLVVANGEQVEVVGTSTCKVRLVNSENVQTAVMIEKVMFVPSINSNLLSVNKLLSKGFSVYFKDKSCKIFKNNKEIAVADNISSLYKLRSVDMHKALSITCHSDRCQHYWHRIFGHRDPAAIKKMFANNLVINLKLSDCGIEETGSIYCEGK